MTDQTETAVKSEEFPAGPPAGDRHLTFLPDPMVDALLRAVVTLTMELSVTRERLKSLEQVLDHSGESVSAQIEALAVSAEDDTARRAERERLVEAILAPVVAAAAKSA